MQFSMYLSDSEPVQKGLKGALSKLNIGNLKKSDQSKIWFGGISHKFLKSKYPALERLSNAEIDKKIIWVPVTSKKHWEIDLQLVKINDGKRSILRKNSTVLLDSGSTYTYLPKDSYEHFSKSLPSKKCNFENNHQYCSCEKTDKFPNVTLIMGKAMFVLKASQYLEKVNATSCLVLMKQKTSR